MHLYFVFALELTFSADTYYDGIASPDQMKDMYQHFIWHNSKQGLRDLLAMALGIRGIMRSDDQLRITLLSMSLQEFPNEGPSPCYTLVITMHESKTNHHGKTEYSTIMHHKQVDMCPIAFLGMLFFAS